MQQSPASPPPIRVLVVEDDLIFQKIIQAYLRHPSANTKVVLAESLAEGIEQLGIHEIDAVLLDLTLPDSEGMATPLRLRDHAPRVPVIVLTGIDDDELAQEAVRRGAQDFIVKTDLNPGLLNRAIRYAIERSGAEAALRDSERRYRAVVEDQTELVCRFLADGRLTFVNGAFSRFFQRPQPQLLEANFFELTGDDTLRRYFSGLGRQRPTGTREQTLESAEGGAWFQWTDRALFDADAQLVEFQSVGRDITKRKKLEQQLLRSQKMEALGRLAGGLAHDFNNLLTVITACCGLLHMEARAQGQTKSSHVSEIEKAAKRAADLTQRLLAVSSRHVAQPVVLDLNEVVRETDEMLRRLIGERVEVVVDLEPGIRPIEADRGQIEQILVNLVVNARDAMPDGGRLAIRTAMIAPDPEDPEGPRPAWAQLEVRDSGVGIPPEHRERIFEPFFTTREESDRSGLGLSIVASLVEQSKARLEVESEPGRGSRFLVRFPTTRASRPAVEAPESDALAAPRVRPGTILLVEDEELVRSAVCALLEPYGFEVLAAESAEEALGKLDEIHGKLDAMLTDVVLPGRDNGFQLAEKVQERYPEIGILFMSGYTDTPDTHPEILESGVNFLQKPFSPDELVAKLVEVMGPPGGPDDRSRKEGPTGSDRQRAEINPTVASET